MNENSNEKIVFSTENDISKHSTTINKSGFTIQLNKSNNMDNF